MRLSLWVIPRSPGILLALIMGTFPQTGRSQPSVESTHRGPSVESPETGRLANGLWPAGTPTHIVHGYLFDALPPIVDGVGTRSATGSLHPFDELGDHSSTDFESNSAASVQEDGCWSLVPPPRRGLHSGAYDPVRRRLLLFGGTDGVAAHNDVWSLSLKSHKRWELIAVEGEPPRPRGHAAMVYDPTRDRMIMFGGSSWPGGAGGETYGDVWELSLRGRSTWRQVLPSGVGPSPRRGASAVYDPIGDRLILFGGLTDDGGWSGETWALSLLKSSRWERLEALGTPPSARWSHSAVYDPVHHRMVVFGGNGIAGFANNDAYELSLGNDAAWTRIVPVDGLPPRRMGHSAIYDPVRNNMVVFGGTSGDFPLRDTWILSLSGAPIWSLAEVDPTVGGRVGHVGVYDSANDRLIVDGGGLQTGTWAFELSSPVWIRVDSPFGAPPHRGGHSAIYDALRHRVIIFGTHYGVGDAQFDHEGAPWALSLEKQPEWRPIGWSGRPVLVWNHPAFYDPALDRMLVLRGRLQDMTEVWQLSLGDETWSALAPTGEVPQARGHVTGVLDVHRRRIVVFGLGSTMRETWALELEGGPRWVRLVAANPPAARGHAAAVYDPVRKRMLLFGGRSPTFQLMNDLWALDLSSSAEWVQLTPSGIVPQGRMSSSAIYDPVGDRMIVYGGWPIFGEVDALWSVSLAQSVHWRRLTTLEPQPIPRDAHVAVYDPRGRRMFISGGGGGGISLSDSWFLNLGRRTSPEEGESDENGMSDVTIVGAQLHETSEAVSFRVSARSEPNPFIGSTRIEMMLPDLRSVRASVCDSQGRKVRVLERGDFHAGRFAVDWDGRDTMGRRLPPGLYFFAIDVGKERVVRRVFLLR